MKVRILSVADKGVREKERLIIKVDADTDIGDYLLLQTGYEESQVTVDVFNTFWFPYKPVGAGDLVVVYTKSGRDRERPNNKDSSKKVHFFYWGLDAAIWNSEKRAPVVFHAPEWISKSPSEL